MNLPAPVKVAWERQHPQCQWVGCYATHGLETHHIIGGYGRVDVPANWFRLCRLHHRVYHEHAAMFLPGIVVRKSQCDPEEHDLEVLDRLKGRKILV